MHFLHVVLSSLEVEAEYQLQLQARNSFGWGKVLFLKYLSHYFYRYFHFFNHYCLFHFWTKDISKNFNPAIFPKYKLQLGTQVSHQFNFQTNMVQSTPVEEVNKDEVFMLLMTKVNKEFMILLAKVIKDEE